MGKKALNLLLEAGLGAVFILLLVVYPRQVIIALEVAAGFIIGVVIFIGLLILFVGRHFNDGEDFYS